MGLRDYLTGIVQEAIQGIDILQDERLTAMQKARRYRYGNQPKSIKVKAGNTDDNITVNFTGLLVDRATSMLFGDGVDFDLPGEGESEAQKYIDAVWNMNKRDELLVDISDYGATFGTPCFHIIPNAIEKDGSLYPEILTIDPMYLTIVAEPENYRRVKMYVIEYRINKGTKERADWRTRRIEIEPVKVVDEINELEIIVSWIQNYYIQNDSGQNELEDTKAWEYPFPPILPFKNLPEAGTPYGRPDLTEDVLLIQDSINRVVTSTNKAIRMTSFQRLWGKFLKNAEPVSLGIDRILSVDNEKAELNAIDAGSNFEGMIAFQNELRDAMFTIARSADPAVLKDKVGQLTNFGLRVLYKDALDKLKTKRRLYGEALTELNRRLLILAGMEGDPGEIVWKEPLPQDESELVQGYTFDLDNKIASKQTIRQKRGYDEEQEAERLQSEKEDEPEPVANPLLTNGMNDNDTRTA